MRPAELDGPTLPDYLVPAWMAFLELHLRRGSNGFGLSSLSYSEIAAWQAIEYEGRRAERWIIDAILHLDGTFMAYTAEVEAKRQRAAKAASAALPPWRSISTPAAAARGSAALTIPVADETTGAGSAKGAGTLVSVGGASATGADGCERVVAQADNSSGNSNSSSSR